MSNISVFAKDVADWIKYKDEFVVITHVRPDGDAYGSAQALVLALRVLGKKAFAGCDDIAEARLDYLPLNSEVATIDKLPFCPQNAIAVDAADYARMGQLGNVFDACSGKCVIDHHATNTGFGDINYIQNTASCGELVLNVIDELKLPFTKDMAECIYTAVSTDSGNFSYQSTQPSTFVCAARCLEAGIDLEELTRKLYRTRSAAKTHLIGRVLSELQIIENGLIAAARLTSAMYKETGTTEADAHTIVNYLNEIEGVRIGILAEDRPDGLKLSFRGTPGMDVSAIAAQFGGGGHKAAAGAYIKTDDTEAAYNEVISAARAAVRA